MRLFDLFSAEERHLSKSTKKASTDVCSSNRSLEHAQTVRDSAMSKETAEKQKQSSHGGTRILSKYQYKGGKLNIKG